MKARAIPCPHQPPTRGDNTVSVAQGGTATSCATKQLLPPDTVLRELYIYIYIYIYMPYQLNAETTLDVNLHYLSAVWDLKRQKKPKKTKTFTFGSWCYYAFTVTVSYVTTRERWFCVYFLHAENFLAFDQIQLDAYRAVVWRRFEATFKYTFIYIYIYIYTKWYIEETQKRNSFQVLGPLLPFWVRGSIKQNLLSKFFLL